MENGNEEKQEGTELLETVVALTGLPKDWIESELTTIIEKSGHEREAVTLDQLRHAMAAYLERMHEDMAEAEAREYSSGS